MQISALKEQTSGLDQNTIGQRQDVICSISVPPDVDPELNEDDVITADSRARNNSQTSDIFRALLVLTCTNASLI